METIKIKYKILNLYACLGGNRYKWDEVAKEKGIEIEVTAVEWDEQLAKLYQDRFPNDKVIVADAHQYLLEHYKEFDFIWSSPPCPSHSRVRFSQANSDKENYDPSYPEMTLYQEIIFLDNYFKGKYVVENVIPYYEPLIQAQKRGRHLYWCNFRIPNVLSTREKVNISNTKEEVKNFVSFIKLNCQATKALKGKIKLQETLLIMKRVKQYLHQLWELYYGQMSNKIVFSEMHGSIACNVKALGEGCDFGTRIFT